MKIKIQTFADGTEAYSTVERFGIEFVKKSKTVATKEVEIDEKEAQKFMDQPEEWDLKDKKVVKKEKKDKDAKP